MKIWEKQETGRLAGLKRLALNKWTLTFAVMLIMLSAYLGLEENERRLAPQAVLYVPDTLPYDVQKVSGEGTGKIELLDDGQETEDGQDMTDNNDKAEGNNTEPAVGDDLADLQQDLDKAGEFSVNSDSDFFINYRLEREKARSRQLELLQGLIDDSSTSETVREAAQQRIMSQAEAIEQELLLESLLVAKYGGEAAVFIQPAKINVVLSGGKETLSDSEAAKIAALVDNYTKIGYENVIVVLKE